MTVDLVARQMPPLPPRPPQEYLDWNQAPAMLAVIGTLWALAMLCVLLRVYVRGIMLKSFGVDDWMMVFSAALSSTCLGLFVELTKHGVGRHIQFYTFVRPDWLIILFKLLWWYAWIIVIAYSAIKISIAFFLLRLAGHRRHWVWILYTIIVVLVLFTIGSVLSLILQCKPIAAAWDFSLRGPPFNPEGTGTCYSTDIYRNTGVFNSTFNLVSDLILALLPIPMVWKLQTNTRTRVSLCIVLGLGLFACATAVYKIPLQYNFFNEPDSSGKGAWYYVWQQIEMNVGIIAACLPTLKPLAANFFEAVSALTSGGAYGRGTSGNSRPFVSNGYLKHQDRSGNASYAMDDVKGSGANSGEHSPYEEKFDKSRVTYSTHQRRGSGSAESNESVLPLHHKGGIMRTTEVEVR